MERGRARPDDDRLIDFQRVKELTGFTLRSVWRHKLLFLSVFAFTVVAAASVYKTLPRHYRAGTTIRLSRDPLLSAMVDPRRYYSRDLGPAPQEVLKSALNQQFLLSLVDRHDLVHRWHASLSPLQRARDAILSPLSKPADPDAARLKMLGTLQDRLHVTWNDDGRVDVSIDWPDPWMAQALVADVQAHFLEARRQQQMAAASHAITVLGAALDGARGDVDQAVAAVNAERARLRRGSKASTLRGLQAEGKFGTTPDANLLRLRRQILADRAEISGLEAQRASQLATLEAQIAELSARYSEDYPTLAEARRQADALRVPSAAVQGLRSQEQQLMADFARGGGRDVDLTELPTAPSFPDELERTDPRLIHASNQLREVSDRYGDLRDRLQSAQLELAASKSASDEGFAVVRAPTLPLEPFAPKLSHVLAGGILAALLLALLATLFFDLRGGRLIESWQVERAVGPILAEVPER